MLGMTWSGAVALDVCALVCRGNRVLSEDHFVFYNNQQTPDGSVRAVPAAGPDKAAVRVAFDALPEAADRLVLVAAVDPEVNPDADLSGFTDACIRLLDPAMTELGRLEVSDGRARETALVLGSFRHRSNGDWDFVKYQSCSGPTSSLSSAMKPSTDTTLCMITVLTGPPRPACAWASILPLRGAARWD
ncbi:hypothetical protein GCM10009535_35630 [Streptomyces thermocarboxydovorans]|uniref:TerD domain-containing protein n=1 Tax=Streptomyces thermocarboxydovorans TaxID=59298 RepID=A0ABP3SN49_9ACTN